MDPDLFLRNGFLTRFRVEAFEYLGREIFAAQPPVVQDMLIRASLVRFVDPSLIRELSGGVDTERSSGNLPAGTCSCRGSTNRRRVGASVSISCFGNFC